MKFRRPTPSSTAPTSLKQVQAILDSTTTTKGNTDRCLTVFRTPFCQTRSNLPPLSSTHTTHSIIIAVMCEWLRWKCLCLLCHRVCFFHLCVFFQLWVCAHVTYATFGRRKKESTWWLGYKKGGRKKRRGVWVNLGRAKYWAVNWGGGVELLERWAAKR